MFPCRAGCVSLTNNAASITDSLCDAFIESFAEPTADFFRRTSKAIPGSYEVIVGQRLLFGKRHMRPDHKNGECAEGQKISNRETKWP